MTAANKIYSSISEVTAFTRHLLDGQSVFNSTTRPTAAEVQGFLRRASATLNVALEGVGVDTPITQEDARLLCDDWVTQQGAKWVELTQRGVGFNEEEGSRLAAFNPGRDASKFAKDNRLGMLRLGATASAALSQGLQFTGSGTQADRTDRDDSDLEQPLFERHQFEGYDGGDAHSGLYGSAEDD